MDLDLTGKTAVVTGASAGIGAAAVRQLTDHGARVAFCARGADAVETEIAGRPWTQKPFPYQGKCLTWLRESHAALPTGARKTVDALLEGTGCEALFA